MTECGPETPYLQAILENGLDGIAEAIRELFDEAMKLERENHLQAGRDQRSETRAGYANGYKPRAIQTRVGQIRLAVPQAREGDFYPSCLERGLRSERAPLATMAEMHAQGVSTRNVTDILEKMCGLEVSAPQVSKATAALDGAFKEWRERRLDAPVDFPLVDARCETVRRDGRALDTALPVSYGIQPDGHRRVLGVSVSHSEAEVHWRAFFEFLTARGLHGLKMIISGSHSGMRAARRAVFPSAPWQRCQFHIQKNASARIPKKAMQTEVHRDIRNIFAMPSREEAQDMLKRTVTRYREDKHTELADWMGNEIQEGFTVFSAVENDFARRCLRATNMVEFQNKELKKRTRAIRVFPNKEALPRVASAMLIELDDKWLSETKAYI
jgi:putative transposase